MGLGFEASGLGCSFRLWMEEILHHRICAIHPKNCDILGDSKLCHVSSIHCIMAHQRQLHTLNLVLLRCRLNKRRNST